jgi:hypothetical protein
LSVFQVRIRIANTEEKYRIRKIKTVEYIKLGGLSFYSIYIIFFMEKISIISLQECAKDYAEALSARDIPSLF